MSHQFYNYGPKDKMVKEQKWIFPGRVIIFHYKLCIVFQLLSVLFWFAGGYSWAWEARPENGPARRAKACYRAGPGQEFKAR
jgi:hypothetical protein